MNRSISFKRLSVLQDVFAQVLNYYNGDYKNASVNFNAVSQPSAANAKNLYNGMITSQLSYTAYDQIESIGGAGSSTKR